MKVAVTGASGVLGRGLVARLLSQGHEVTGIARHRPKSWPAAAEFVATDIRDPAAVGRAIQGADGVAHCAWASSAGPDRRISQQVNLDGTRNVLQAMNKSGTGRIIFTSSAHVYGPGATAFESDRTAPTSAEGVHKAHVEQMLADSGARWVAIRSALIVGRYVDNWALRLLTLPVFPNGSADSVVQVVHVDDVLRVLARAVLGTDSGAVNLAAPGELTLHQIAAALGRPLLPVATSVRRHVSSFAEFELVQGIPVMDTTRLHDEWQFHPAWTAEESLADFSLAVRGRVSLGRKVIALPWRLATIQDLPAVDAPAEDGVIPRLSGPEGVNGEFDTPIDPRFPTFLATNLSEALPGPFSPSSASVTVRGLRAGGVGIAERLRPGGVIQREIAMRTVAVFAHRLYGAITSAHFMAETVPFAKPSMIVSNSGFFGPSMASLPIFGEQRPSESRRAHRLVRTLRNIGVFGVNLVGLSAGSPLDTNDYLEDVDRLEYLSREVSRLDDRRLLSLILLARDHVVHGWVLASGSFMLCAALNVLLRGLSGHDAAPAVGPQLVSARSVEAVRRLVLAARSDPAVLRVLDEPGERLGKLAVAAPEFYAAVLQEISLIGHRGPAEVEMLSTSYADNPELLVRMVTKALSAPSTPQPERPAIPWRAKPIALLAARQLRDREVRRDKMVRAIWVLRGLLREHGNRLVEAGVLDNPDDVFYLLVDELDALPAEAAALAARRRAEQRRLSAVVPPTVFSGSWEPSTGSSAALMAGETLRGVGVCGGRVRGRVRIVRPETIDDLQPGEILVAEVTDVGYTAAFCYAAAVVTELGGPMSHAAVVAREFGFPCVVDVQNATSFLPSGALIEVDGATGEIHVLELATGGDEAIPASNRGH
ncbi:sugar epimerase family protein [Mycobacterium simiae]|uniref:Sugar epimerase family protein n=1 Tax=Mycobacterium simiae TaxID=1784 RepID=A0A5B1BIP9_MYCSI|nr:sugar epimerase family protein [Mycobacterium simiae]KAA1247370.1 sugar epimerase family protein [Mycobacterium simiae]